MTEKYTRIIITFLLAIVAICAQAKERTLTDPGDGRIPYYKGYYWKVDEAGDSVVVLVLTDVYCYNKPITFKNKKEKEEYDRLVNNIKVTLPYAKLIAETLIETYEYISTFPTQEERDEYLKTMEHELFKQYKPVLKRFSKRQAKVLIKLVQRETHQSSYNIVKAFLGTFRATFWQGFGRLFGVSLKSSYDPEKDSEDARIERIASQVELGLM